MLLVRTVMCEPKLLKIDGHDNAVVGYTCNLGGPLLVYSMEIILNNLTCHPHNMTADEAYDFFWYNIAGTFMGPETPVIIHFDNGEYFNDINLEREPAAD